MRTYHAQTTVPWTQAQVYALIADVARYPDFLPGWRKVSVIRASENRAEVSQEIGIGPVSLKFISAAVFCPLDKITIRSRAAPFSHLHLCWTLAAAEPGCRVTLLIEAAFRSRLLAGLHGRILESLAQRMLRAFERRAFALYGSADPADVKSPSG